MYNRFWCYPGACLYLVPTPRLRYRRVWDSDFHDFEGRGRTIGSMLGRPSRLTLSNHTSCPPLPSPTPYKRPD